MYLKRSVLIVALSFAICIFYLVLFSFCFENGLFDHLHLLKSEAPPTTGKPDFLTQRPKNCAIIIIIIYLFFCFFYSFKSDFHRHGATQSQGIGKVINSTKWNWDPLSKPRILPWSSELNRNFSMFFIIHLTFLNYINMV